MSTRVLVVGGTGNLGAKIVRELLARRPALVRVLVREDTKADLAALRAAGVELVPGDLRQELSLARACEGIDVVVSAVQGLAEILVDGQTRLLRAAEDARVARMIPSDFAVDFFKTTPGGNRNLDLRREFNHVLDDSRVRGTSVLCGAFMDMLAWGAMGPDPKTNIYKVWGDPDQLYDFTCTDDVAKYVAAVALDAEAGRHVRVAGDTQSPRGLATIIEELRKTPVTIERAGSIAELGELIARLQDSDPAPGSTFPPWQRLQYTRDMASGAGRLVPLDNARYPAIRPLDIRTYLSSATTRVP